MPPGLAIQFCADIHVSHRTSPTDFGLTLTFPVVPPFVVLSQNKLNTHCHVCSSDMGLAGAWWYCAHCCCYCYSSKIIAPYDC